MMLSLMLFEDSIEETKKKETLTDATVVRKGSLLSAALLPVYTALLVTAGCLSLILKPIPQYFVLSICLFAASLVPLFFLLDHIVFRLSVGSGRIALRRLGAAETIYSYTDVSWKMQSPGKKRSAILLYVKGKQVGRILPGATHYGVVTTLRHKGSLTEGEKRLLKGLSTSK